MDLRPRTFKVECPVIDTPKNYWMKHNRWLKSQRHLPPKPFLEEGGKLKIEV